VHDLAWHQHAACRGADPAQFFPVEDPGRGRNDRPLAAAAARRWCSQCPVVDTCKAWADAAEEIGVWGGTVRWRDGNRYRIRNLLQREAS
jgi:WhiB family redox-sensing transcriptional regulator